jgi:hypothetical protein
MAVADQAFATAPDPHRLEARIAIFLTRNPDATMGAISEALVLNTVARRQLSLLLRSYPSFELESRYGWAVGGIRGELETRPSSSDRCGPRGTASVVPGPCANSSL